MEQKKPTNAELRTYVDTLYKFAKTALLSKENHDNLFAVYQVLLLQFQDAPEQPEAPAQPAEPVVEPTPEAPEAKAEETPAETKPTRRRK